MQSLDFAQFDYADTDILIPPNTIFYRGIDKPVKTVIRPTPMYLGPKHIAQHYAGSQGHIYTLLSPKELRLLDIRKMRSLLKSIVASRPITDTDPIITSLIYLTLSFGLCSYSRQVQLLQAYYDQNTTTASKEERQIMRDTLQRMIRPNHTPFLAINPIETEGVRIPETIIDGKSVLICKELFGQYYDGFIAPQLISPYRNAHCERAPRTLPQAQNSLQRQAQSGAHYCPTQEISSPK